MDKWLAEKSGDLFVGKMTPSAAILFSIAANFVGLKTLGQLEKAMDDHASTLKSFEDKMIDVWSAYSTSNVVTPGLSVYRLSLYLAALHGSDFVSSMLDTLHVKPDFRFSEETVKAAKEA